MRAKPLVDAENERSALGRRARLDRARRWIRSCPLCQSFLPPIDTICEGCWKDLGFIQNRGVELSQEGRPFPLHSLFIWNEEHNELVGGLVRALKGGLEFRATQDLVERLSSERRFIGGLGSPVAFIPPPRGKRRRDHAWLMAQLLGELWGCPVLDVLQVAEDESALPRDQKRLKASQRLDRRYMIGDEDRQRLPSGVLVFVDDVVTTGATAMAAFMALADPLKFEVWTIANRPKLAASKGV